MQRYEYKVVPAPVRGEKLRGVRTTEDRFANTLGAVLNAQSRDGWDYMHTETMPSEERAGLTRTRTVYLNLLVFRRQIADTDTPRLGAPAADSAPRLPPIVLTATDGPAPTSGPKLGPAG